MRAISFVALGGAVGSVLRYLLTKRIGVADSGFPVATFTVNVVGSFVLGVLIGLIAARFSTDVRTGLFVGLLGGFTTYSTFAFESSVLVRDGMAGVAASYVVATLVFGVGAAWLGLILGEMAGTA
jgi:CrcB protein